MQPGLLLPEIMTFTGGLIVLLAGSFLPKYKQWVARGITALILLGALVVAAWTITDAPQTGFAGTFLIDTVTGTARIMTTFATLLILGVASADIAGLPREADTYALMLFATTGVLVLAGANDLLIVIVGYLLASIPLYGLIGVAGQALAAEATMKSYLLGSLSGIVMLLGVIVLYALAGDTAYAQLTEQLSAAPSAAVGAGILCVLIGLLFKAGAAPAHFWIPDAAQSANATAATFLTTVPKIGALIAIYRFIGVVATHHNAWLMIIALLATLSMFLGNLAAYWQHDPRRLLGWSTVAQVGFLLVPITAIGHSELAAPGLLFYLGAYVLANIAGFAVSAALPKHRKLHDYRGLARARPWLAAALLIALLSFVGIPPTAVFVGKFTTATAAWDGGYGWLALLVMLNSLLSLFYYLRWFGPAFARATEHSPSFTLTDKATRWPATVAVVAATASLGLGVLAGLVWTILDGPISLGT